MKKVLFVNTDMIKCGIHQYGVSLFDIISQSDKFEFYYQNHPHGIVDEGFDIVIFNHHPVVMPWLNQGFLDSIKAKKIVISGHDYFPEFGGYDLLLNCDSTSTDNPIGRPVFSRFNYPSVKAPVPVIGSFGFSFGWKGFDRLVKLCEDNFERSYLNLSLPHHSFESGSDAAIPNMIRSMESERVKIFINEGFLDTIDLIRFLAQNDINVFLYPDKFEMGYRGLSSAIDYALSAKRPIAISDSPMFRHIDHEDRIRLSKFTLKEILEFGDTPIQGFLNKWNEKNLITEFESIIENV